MSVISNFADYLQITREMRHGGSRASVLNLACRRYNAWPHFIRGMKYGQKFRGGTHIVEPLMLVDAGNGGEYTPGTPETLTRGQSVHKIRQTMRFIRNSEPVVDAELLSNEGSMEGRFAKLEPLISQKIETNHYNTLDHRLFRKPDADNMEPLSIQPGKVMSVPALITENRGTNPYRAPGWGATQATLQGLDPSLAALENYRPQLVNYNPAAKDDPDNGILSGLDKLILRCGRVGPTRGNYFEGANENLEHFAFFTNTDGVDQVSSRQRAAQDHMPKDNDGSYFGPQHKGYDIVPVSTLNTELLSETAGVYDNTPYPTGKPRYFGLNMATLYFCAHEERFLKVMDAMNAGVTQPDTTAVYMVTWGNLICVDLGSNGILAPS